MRVHTFSLYAALKLILAYINELLQKHLEKRKKKDDENVLNQTWAFY